MRGKIEVENMTTTLSPAIKAGAIVRFASVVGGIFDRDYRVHVLHANCAVLADCETGALLLLQGGFETWKVPLSALKCA